jgi:hypothetical protein
MSSTRAERRNRLRRAVAAASAAVLVASFGVVATWGRQPATRAAAPATTATPDTVQQEQPEPEQPEQEWGAPMTTRQS